MEIHKISSSKLCRLTLSGLETDPAGTMCPPGAARVKVVTDWFFENYMSLNPSKYHYMCLGKNEENDRFNFGNISLENSKEELILGLTIGNKHFFNNHVKKICRKASQKTCALSRKSNYSDSKQKEIIFLKE